jgi:hypothetical protein
MENHMKKLEKVPTLTQKIADSLPPLRIGGVERALPPVRIHRSMPDGYVTGQPPKVHKAMS